MNEKKIVLFFILTLLISSVFLSALEMNQRFAISKDARWEIYFENPAAPDLNFTIMNNGPDENFSWKLKAGDAVIQEDQEQIPSGKSKVIIPGSIPTGQNEKIRLEISDQENNSKEIHKAFPYSQR